MGEFVTRMSSIPAWEPWIPDGHLYSSEEFNDPLIIPKILARGWDGRTCKFVRPWVYQYIVAGLKIIMIADVGFVTNGGSIPKLFHNIVSPMGAGVAGYFPHDLGYGTQFLTREIIDKIMTDMHSLTKMTATSRKAVYLAVKWFGGSAWNSCRELRDAEGNLCDYGVWNSTKTFVPDRARLHSKTYVMQADGQYESLRDNYRIEESLTFADAVDMIKTGRLVA